MYLCDTRPDCPAPACVLVCAYVRARLCLRACVCACVYMRGRMTVDIENKEEQTAYDMLSKDLKAALQDAFADGRRC